MIRKNHAFTLEEAVRHSPTFARLAEQAADSSRRLEAIQALIPENSGQRSGRGRLTMQRGASSWRTVRLPRKYGSCYLCSWPDWAIPDGRLTQSG